MQETFADVRGWIYAQHPQYDGWPIQKFAWHYDTCASSPSEIVSGLHDVLDEHGDLGIKDIRAYFSRVQPPEGYVYVILEKDEDMVGFNVPEEVFGTLANQVRTRRNENVPLDANTKPA